MGPKKLSGNVWTGGQGMALATHYSQVPNLQMYRSIPQLPHVPVFHR